MQTDNDLLLQPIEFTHLHNLSVTSFQSCSFYSIIHDTWSIPNNYKMPEGNDWRLSFSRGRAKAEAIEYFEYRREDNQGSVSSLVQWGPVEM